MCQRFGCLPSALMREDTTLLQLVAIEARGNPHREEVDPLGE